MGKKPDEIDREIRQRRDQITRRIEGLQGRVQQDLQAARDEAQSRAQQFLDDARGAFDVNSQMNEHPLGTLAGAFGLGALLGLVSDSADVARDGRRVSSGLGGAVSSFLGPVTITIQEEARELVRQGFASLKDRRGTSNGASPQTEAGETPQQRAYSGH